MSTPDPFGFHSQCTKEGIDTQLMTDTFANTINTTFTFRCCSTFIGFGCIDQPVLPFHTCGEANQNVADYASMTFCIGGLFEQHACAADGCQQISRAGVISQQCPQQLIDYMKVQPVGAQFACCDSSSCVVGTDYTCPTSRSLQLCVGDGIGAECLNPQNLAICSGNYTSTVSGDSPQTPSGQGGTAPNSDTTQITVPTGTSSAGSSHSGLGPSDIATIVGSTLGAITSIVGIWLAFREIKKRRARRKDNKEEQKEHGDQQEENGEQDREASI